MTLPKIVVMVSGDGTNLQALTDAIDDEHLYAEIALVISNRKNAYALSRARSANIPTLYFPLKPYTEAGRSREEYDADLALIVSKAEPDLIVLAGWMHILSESFLNHFPQRVINLHPALPGEFPGMDAIERAYDAYKHGEIHYSGCMVHYVVPEVDAGPVIGQAVVALDSHDSLEDFQERMHAAEHQLIVQTVALVLDR